MKVTSVQEVQANKMSFFQKMCRKKDAPMLPLPIIGSVYKISATTSCMSTVTYENFVLQKHGDKKLYIRKFENTSRRQDIII